MSSTYAHYQGRSESLPSAYAILSRRNTLSYESTLGSPPENPSQIPRLTRRESFPAEYYHRPLNPTIGIYPRIDPDSPDSEASQHLTCSPTETSPLLNNPPMPRIEENISCDPSADNASKFTMFWEELVILTKYALPVFGYDPRSFLMKNFLSQFFTALNFLSTLLS